MSSNVHCNYQKQAISQNNHTAIMAFLDLQVTVIYIYIKFHINTPYLTMVTWHIYNIL